MFLVFFDCNFCKWDNVGQGDNGQKTIDKKGKGHLGRARLEKILSMKP